MQASGIASRGGVVRGAGLESPIAGILALLAAAAFALSTVLQQRGTFQVPNLSLDNPKALLRLLSRPVWLVAFGVMAVGWALQAAALDRGRVAVVQPFLTMTLVFVLPLGVWLTAQRVSRREIAAALVIVGGLIAFATAGDPANGRDDAPGEEWLLATVAVTAFCGLVLLFGNRGGPATRAVANGTVSGVTAGLTAVMAKPVLIELHEGLPTVLADPKTYVVVVYGLLGVVFQQYGLATGKLASTVASGSVANPLVSVALGALLLDEALARPDWRVAVALGGLGVALAAAVVIATAPHSGAEKTELPG